MKLLFLAEPGEPRGCIFVSRCWMSARGRLAKLARQSDEWPVYGRKPPVTIFAL
jgi:hypothetical protein